MKEVIIADDVIKIIERKKKFLSLSEDEKIINFPVHMIKLVQKAYTDSMGISSVAIFLESDEEFLITYDETEDLEWIFAEFVALKVRTDNSFRVEEYNIETRVTIDK